MHLCFYNFESICSSCVLCQHLPHYVCFSYSYCVCVRDVAMIVVVPHQCYHVAHTIPSVDCTYSTHVCSLLSRTQSQTGPESCSQKSTLGPADVPQSRRQSQYRHTVFVLHRLCQCSHSRREIRCAMFGVRKELLRCFPNKAEPCCAE